MKKNCRRYFEVINSLESDGYVKLGRRVEIESVK